MPRHREFRRRPPQTREPKPLFIIACEGKVTEPEYFRRFGGPESAVSVKILGCSGNSPDKLLSKMRQYLTQEPLIANEEAWIVVDRNSWPIEVLNDLLRWERSNDRHGLGFSNPMFEYWLLLHFEDGDGIGSAQECVDRLRNHLPGYDKSSDRCRLTQNQIQEAIRRAKLRPACSGKVWMKRPGTTTVHRLVEKLTKARKRPK